MNELFGIPIIVSSYKKQKKTSKYKLINWLYKKIYGYEEVSMFPEDTFSEGINFIYFDNKLYLKNKEAFDWLVNEIEKYKEHKSDFEKYVNGVYKAKKVEL